MKITRKSILVGALMLFEYGAFASSLPSTFKIEEIDEDMGTVAAASGFSEGVTRYPVVEEPSGDEGTTVDYIRFIDHPELLLSLLPAEREEIEQRIKDYLAIEGSLSEIKTRKLELDAQEKRLDDEDFEGRYEQQRRIEALRLEVAVEERERKARIQRMELENAEKLLQLQRQIAVNLEGGAPQSAPGTVAVPSRTAETHTEAHPDPEEGKEDVPGCLESIRRRFFRENATTGETVASAGVIAGTTAIIAPYVPNAVSHFATAVRDHPRVAAVVSVVAAGGAAVMAYNSSVRQPPTGGEVGRIFPRDGEVAPPPAVLGTAPRVEPDRSVARPAKPSRVTRVFGDD